MFFYFCRKVSGTDKMLSISKKQLLNPERDFGYEIPADAELIC